jgi:hypothetical protein
LKGQAPAQHRTFQRDLAPVHQTTLPKLQKAVDLLLLELGRKALRSLIYQQSRQNAAGII